MTSQPSMRGSGDFLAVAVELKLLPADTVDDLRNELQASGDHPAAAVLRKGLLNAVQIDMVETLLRSDSAIPDYEILGVLGVGGMGVVYRARQKNLDRAVAIKTVLVSQMNDPGRLARFEREAMTVARLQHPHIVAAYDFGRVDGRVYFVMELVNGEDVERLIGRTGALEESLALGLIRQAAAGLAHAEQAGIIHRDIKPANLLLVAPPAGFPLPAGMPMVKIADFGLAYLSGDQQAATRLTAANTVVGSPHYMAPEQILGEAIDHRADCYSLGATLYHMLAGIPPFQGASVAQVIAQKLSGRYTPLRTLREDLSEAVTELVDDMMDPVPHERLPNFLALLDRLDGMMRLQPASVQPSIRIASASASVTANGEATMVHERSPRPAALADATPAAAAAERPRSFPETGVLRRKRLRYLSAAVLFTVLCLAGAAVRWYSGSAGRISERDMVESGWSEALFNGKTLGGLPTSGLWNVSEDEEGAVVIAGEDGQFRRALVRADGNQQRLLRDYRVTVFVKPWKASAVELLFRIDEAAGTTREQSVLRIASDRVELFRRRGDSEAPAVATKTTPLPVDPQRYHSVVLEHQYGCWWVFLDDRLVGTEPPLAGRSLPEIRLGVEGGPAWFSDFMLDELVAPGVGPD